MARTDEGEISMSVVIRYHCDVCGKFINKNEVMKKGELHYCKECYKDTFMAPVYTQASLKVF